MGRLKPEAGQGPHGVLWSCCALCLKHPPSGLPSKFPSSFKAHLGVPSSRKPPLNLLLCPPHSDELEPRRAQET